MPDADVAGASRGDLAWWAAQFRHYAETDQCCTAAGYLAAAKRLDRAAAEPVEPLPAAPGQQETVDGPYGPVRSRRPGPYPPARAAGGKR